MAWQWCHTENSTAYGKLLSTIPAPRVITTDGNGGSLKAIAHHCPRIGVQHTHSGLVIRIVFVRLVG